MYNYADFYREGRCCMSGGLFSGKGNYLREVCDRAERIFIETVEKGYGHADEQIFHYVYHEKPELFEFNYGYYYQLFTNGDRIKTNISRIMNNVVRPTRQNGDYQLCYDTCIKIIDGINQGAYISCEMLVSLLDEFYISCFYLKKYEECRRIMLKHGEYIKLYGNEYEKEFNNKIEHIINNTDYCFKFIKGNRNVVYISIEREDNINHELLKKEDEIIVCYVKEYNNNIKSLCCHDVIIRNEKNLLK